MLKRPLIILLKSHYTTQNELPKDVFTSMFFIKHIFINHILYNPYIYVIVIKFSIIFDFKIFEKKKAVPYCFYLCHIDNQWKSLLCLVENMDNVFMYTKIHRQRTLAWKVKSKKSDLF